MEMFTIIGPQGYTHTEFVGPQGPHRSSTVLIDQNIENSNQPWNKGARKGECDDTQTGPKGPADTWENTDEPEFNKILSGFIRGFSLGLSIGIGLGFLISSSAAAKTTV